METLSYVGTHARMPETAPHLCRNYDMPSAETNNLALCPAMQKAVEQGKHCIAKIVHNQKR